MRRCAATLLTVVLVLAACSGSDDPRTAVVGTDTPAPGGDAPSTPRAGSAADVEPYTSEIYDGTTNWLCHPDRSDDACDTDLTVTAVTADGSAATITAERIGEPAIDCFYVYPTVSSDPPPNADLVPGADEERAAPTAFFGHPRDGDGVAGCTNPAALAGGEAPLRPWFRTENVGPAAAGVTTAYVSFAGVVTGRCVDRDGFAYLEVTVDGDGALQASPVTNAGLGPDWGLHVVDANIAMGDLVDLVRSQAAVATG